MSETNVTEAPHAVKHVGWKEFWLKEDWWAIWLGLGIVFAAYLFYVSGNAATMKYLAVTPAKWATLNDMLTGLSKDLPRYGVQFLVWLAIFTVSLSVMGHKAKEFVPSFIFVYVCSIVISIVGAWQEAARYNMEAPLVALALGLLISNFIGLPRWMDSGFRVEYYVKTGIVLLGATLPFTVVVWAGPMAVVQASIVSVSTFLAIFFVGRKLGLDRRLCATLGAGGAVCGVSGAIAIAGAVSAKKEHAPIAITMVIIWAIIMIFFLPLASRFLGLHTGVAGAWIGTSEFADAAGFAAAQAYGQLAGKVEGIAGTADQAVWSFTLMKVIGRDIWIGIWAFVLAIIATTRWEATETGKKPDAAEIWWRFPKFVFGFVIASVFITAVSAGMSKGDFDKVLSKELIGPIKDLRTWAFIFCFFSIGLTTRFRELATAGTKPFLAFTAGVAFNVVLGFILSAVLFKEYWSNLAR
jgi:uncharacterized integral membrane protein (TIGR00698 family)